MRLRHRLNVANINRNCRRGIIWAAIALLAGLLFTGTTQVFASNTSDTYDATTLDVAPSPDVLDHAIGAPGQVPLSDRRDEIRDSVLQRWKQLTEKQGHNDLLNKKVESVTVACIDWSKIGPSPSGFRVSIEHWWMEYDPISLSENRQMALKKCNEWKSAEPVKCDCAVIAENLQPALNVPDAEARRIAEASLPYYNFDRYKKAQKRVLLAQAIALSARSGTAQSEVPIFLGSPVKIGYPYTSVDYSAACWDLYTYALVPVPSNLHPEALRKLATIRDRGMYGCARSEVDGVPGEIEILITDHAPTEEHCRFVKRVAVKKSFLEEFSFPDGLREPVSQLGPQAIWLEVAARVDATGRAIVLMDTAKPLAIESATELFLGVEVSWPKPGWACAVGSYFPKQEVLRIKNCPKATPTEECGSQEKQRLFNSVLEALKGKPLSATQVPHEGPPQEYLFLREDKLSEVLGDPYYECSSYFVQTWSNDSDFTLLVYKRSESRGLNRGNRLFVHLSHVLETKANKLDRCAAPESWQIERYSAAVINRVESAIARECKAIGGVVEGKVCVVDKGGGK